jgi:hypothetical protein
MSKEPMPGELWKHVWYKTEHYLVLKQVEKTAYLHVLALDTGQIELSLAQNMIKKV